MMQTCSYTMEVMAANLVVALRRKARIRSRTLCIHQQIFHDLAEFPLTPRSTVKLAGRAMAGSSKGGRKTAGTMVTLFTKGLELAPFPLPLRRPAHQRQLCNSPIMMWLRRRPQSLIGLLVLRNRPFLIIMVYPLTLVPLDGPPLQRIDRHIPTTSLYRQRRRPFPLMIPTLPQPRSTHPLLLPLTPTSPFRQRLVIQCRRGHRTRNTIVVGRPVPLQSAQLLGPK